VHDDQKTNIGLEVFTNKGPESVLAFSDDIDSVGGSTIKTKGMFLNIEKVGLPINENKTKYMHVRRRAGRDRIGQNITMDTYQ